MKKWTDLCYISKEELHEIKILQGMWGSERWRKHTSRELVRNYDLEDERQIKLIPLLYRE